MRGGFCMKRYKKIVAILLSLALIISTFGIFEVSAATTETRYSKKYLQNGSFEDNTDKYTWSSKYTQPQTIAVPYWDTTAYNTTGSNGKLEFFQDGSAHFNQSITNKVVADGKVAAELNADEVSTIYQRIETVSGSTYTWGLDHRGRDTTDTMVLFIGPEQYAADGTTAIDPSKPKKNDQDQFVKMTEWLKTQYGISYPDKGCSQKYTIYSKPFAENGKFRDESKNADENFSMTQTEKCNQEWNLWVISSVNNNTSTDESEAVNGWSKYGTNCYKENENSYNDVINGAGSKLGYDCTYTVPKGQTKTLFAFCSFTVNPNRYNSSTKAYQYDATYGNLLDDINFKLYQPVSSSITEGGNGGVHTDNATITSDIINGDMFFTTVTDGELCTIRTMKQDDSDTYEFQGAYVTVYKDDGTPDTKFIPIYNGDIKGLSKEERLELSKNNFLVDGTTTEENGVTKTWDYYFNVSVESPVHIHMMYTKAPFILYDSNGGERYRWKNDNSAGGNLVGFRDGFKGSEVGEPSEYSDYYKDVEVEKIDNGDGIYSEKITPGFYKSHAALPNEKWNKITLEDGSVVGSRFLGWAITGIDNKQVILDGEHTATYAPDSNGVGNIEFTDASNHDVYGLILDATHGVTLTAQWQFGYTAQAQTLLGHSLETQTWENSDVGGWVEETFINDRSNVTDYKDAYTPDRTERTDAYGVVGEKIIFRATPDSANDYVFDGWYTKEADGTYKLVTTAPNLAITVEQGNSEAYYARFKTKTVPVIFYYSASGSGLKKDYDYYDKNTNNKYGKFFQEVVYNEKAIKPKNDSQNVTMWFTSPTERDQEHLFNFSTPITEKTELYASPSFTFNYFNYFRFKEPWLVDVYATLKFDGKYIDMKNNADMTNYNIYLLNGDVGDAKPSASDIKSNDKKITISNRSSKIKFNQTTNTGQIFNRVGTSFSDFYIFNMKNPVWVLFDFTYKGITYTSSVKDVCLYNNIETFMKEQKNGFYTTFPPETQVELHTAQTNLLNSMKAMYDKIAENNITEPTDYINGVSVSGLPEGETSETYKFTSKTAIRNIEPWGLKYSFRVNEKTITDFDDYGAVVLTDKSGTYTETPSISNILTDSNSLMYSKSKKNVYGEQGKDGTATGNINVYHINELLTTEFDIKTYVVFFVKDSDGNYHYSEVYSKTYNELSKEDTSEVSQTIFTYAQRLVEYYTAIQKAQGASA